MLYGAQGMLGAMMGGGATYAIMDDPDATNIGLGAVGGSAIMSMPKPAIAWAGLNMRNFSAGYYNKDPLYNMTGAEKLIGNKATSIKRNLASAIRGKGQELGYNNSILNVLANSSSVSDAEAIHNKIVNPTQFEDLQVEMKKLGKTHSSIDEFKNYKNKFGGVNSTPEEAIWWHKKHNALGTNAKIDGQISNINAEMFENDKLLKKQTGLRKMGERLYRDGRITKEQYIKYINRFEMTSNMHAQEGSRLFAEKTALRKGYQRHGEADRKWRHEIAKSESHAMWANKEWSEKRLTKAGYKWEGAYRWGDVKKYMNSVGGAQWEADINKYADKVSKLTGMKKGLMLDNNTSVNVLRNIHKGDKMAKRKPSRVFQRMGREASRVAFENPHWNKKEVLAHLKRKVTDPNSPWKFTIRDIRDYGDSWKNDTLTNKMKDSKVGEILRRDIKHPLTKLPKVIRDRAPAGLIRYDSWMQEYLNMSDYNQRYSPRGQDLFKKMSNAYGNREAGKIVTQMKNKGGFRSATRGRFQLSGIGRVTNSYLEGGINATSDFIPFVEKGTTKVAMRMVTSDLSDLPLSGHTGTQRNIPFIIEEEHRTYNWKSGKEQTTAMTRGNPLYGTEEPRLNEFRATRQERGDVKRYLKGKQTTRAKARYLKAQISKSPKGFLKYAARRLPGVALNPYVMSAGMLAWYMMGKSDGEMELDEIV